MNAVRSGETKDEGDGDADTSQEAQVRAQGGKLQWAKLEVMTVLVRIGSR